MAIDWPLARLIQRRHQAFERERAMLRPPVLDSTRVIDRPSVINTITAQPTSGSLATPWGTVQVNIAVQRKWTGLQGATTTSGDSVQSYLGFALDVSTTTDGAQIVRFEHGMIVLRADGRVFVVYGAIYLHYRELT